MVPCVPFLAVFCAGGYHHSSKSSFLLTVKAKLKKLFLCQPINNFSAESFQEWSEKCSLDFKFPRNLIDEELLEFSELISSLAGLRIWGGVQDRSV